MKMESCNWSGRTKAIEELVKGREMANKLKSLLITNNLSSGELHGNNDGGDYKGDDGSSLSLDRLLTHILTSFSNTLCILNTTKYSNNNNNNNNNGVVSDSDEVSFPAATTTTTTTPRRKSEDSGDSSKCTPPPVVKERRGCYKRRKTSHSWTKETPTLVDDGHAWRKYGQKLILHAEHPRNYFRCTHKYDQGCQATKQVQRLDDEPRLFRTTYYGQHTCIKPLKDSQLILDDPSDHVDSSKLLCFSTNNNVSSTNVKPHPTPTPTPLCDHYNYQIHPSRDHDHDHNKHDGFDQSISGVNSSSCTTSTHSLGFEMDHGIGRVEFTDEDVFQFEF